jgi:hypothetical protein
MVSVTKYPTAYDVTNPDAYTSPENITGVEDTLCARCRSWSGLVKYLQAKTYGFSIPTNAIIDNIFIAIRGAGSVAFGNTANVFMRFDWNGVSSLYVTGNCVSGANYGCNNSAWVTEVDIWNQVDNYLKDYGFSSLDLNNETFKTYIGITASGGSAVWGYADAMYVRVVYHMPPPVVIADTMALSDDTKKPTVTNMIVDAITIADTTKTDKLLITADGITLSDGTGRPSMSLQIPDLISIGDEVLTDKLLILVDDSITLEDKLYKIGTIVINDPLVLTDDVTRLGVIVIVDSVTLQDSVNVQYPAGAKIIFFIPLIR